MILISWLQAHLANVGIGAYMFDGHTNVVEGGPGAIHHRAMVAEDDYTRAFCSYAGPRAEFEYAARIFSSG